MYPQFKSSVLGQKILTVQGITNPYGVECVTLCWDYANALFPGVSIKDTIGLGNANTLLSTNRTYFTPVVNNHNDPNQLPSAGDVMVFGATPADGYTNTFVNPDGHAGICDSASPSGYSLLQQNAPTTGDAVNVTNYPWNFRPCLGWLHPEAEQAAPAPVPPPTVQKVTLPAYVASWAAYKIGSLMRKGTSDQVGTLLPSRYGGLTYDVVSWIGNYAVEIDTQAFGKVDIWVRDTPAVIS
jgi:hypothetical protein